MKKNNKLNQWLWRWHFIAGLISLPFIIVLSITGGIYLFKDKYEKPIHQPIKKVEITGTPITYQKQWEMAIAEMPKKPNTIVIPIKKDQATEFISGKFSHKSSLFIDPYKSKISGTINSNDGLMYKVRKLHGELLLGGFGTKIVELVASWLIVLILTGVYVFWPSRKRGIKAFFIPRVKEGRRTFFKDIHSITGFWISGLLLLVLAGAFPWTDVAGENFKWAQKVTHTGYPMAWHSIGVTSKILNTQVTLDDIVVKAKSLNLDGQLSIELPKEKNGVFSVENTHYENLSAQKKYHFDRYSGEQILQKDWSDVGILMRGRMWVMAFHQGQFGPWNWYLMLLTAFLLMGTSISALVSYSLRKSKGSWGVPKVSQKFNLSYGIILTMLVLGILLPLFGLSLILIFIGFQIKKRTDINYK